MYKDIVLANERFAPVKWWPHYAYHYTDISNAVNILETGMLYSRSRAEKLGVMYNDNASQQVISNTSQKTTSYVRFYFRPLTPTQFYNEGYKHCDLRFNGDVKANVPVPVFFFFDLNQLLSDPKTLFSEGNLRIAVRIQLLWLDGNKILYQKEEEVSVNYLNAMPIVFNNVPEIDGAQKLSVKIYFEKHLMCYCKFLLRNAEY